MNPQVFTFRDLESAILESSDDMKRRCDKLVANNDQQFLILQFHGPLISLHLTVLCRLTGRVLTKTMRFEKRCHGPRS